MTPSESQRLTRLETQVEERWNQAEAFRRETMASLLALTTTLATVHGDIDALRLELRSNHRSGVRNNATWAGGGSIVTTAIAGLGKILGVW